MTSVAPPSAPPGHPPLEAYLARLWREHSNDLEFVALFGSRARGDAFEDSDYDLRVGLRAEDGLRFTDRVAVFMDTESGRVQVFPYPLSELTRMEEDSNALLLEALSVGVPLFDRGAWSAIKARFDRRRADGRLVRHSWGWELR